MSDPTKPMTASRQEKLSVLQALLGADAMQKLRNATADQTDATVTGREAVDPKRVEWHRNRLLERFRSNGQSGTSSTPRAAGPVPAPASPRTAMSIDNRLTQYATSSELAAEHPAVIARLLSRMDRGDRVAALKSLPGPVARAVVQRLR